MIRTPGMIAGPTPDRPYGLLVRHYIFGQEIGIVLYHEILHDACRDHTAAECAEKSDHWLPEESLADHEHHDQKSHAESRSEIGQRYELEFLEIRTEAAVGSERYYSRIVAEKCHHSTERGDTGQIEQRFHQRARDALKKFHDAEFHENASYGTGKHTYAHQIEHSVQQQVVGGMHYGVEHIGHAHHLTEIIENAEYAQQADIGCETTLGPGF